MRWQKGSRREDGTAADGEDVGEDVGEDGGGDEEPSKFREEKVGRSTLSTLVTWRLLDSGVGDCRWWRTITKWNTSSCLLSQGGLVGQLPAGYGGLSLSGHGGGGKDQELVARVEQVKVKL